MVIPNLLIQERLFIGTPGSYYWQGQTYSMNLLNRLDLLGTEEVLCCVVLCRAEL